MNIQFTPTENAQENKTSVSLVTQKIYIFFDTKQCVLILIQVIMCVNYSLNMYKLWNAYFPVVLYIKIKKKQSVFSTVRAGEADQREWHSLWDLSQPVGDSVWGEKSCGEQREGRLPTLTVTKLIKLLAYCEEGEGWRMGSSSLQEAPQQPQSDRAHSGRFSTEAYKPASDGLFDHSPHSPVSLLITVLCLLC